jgi:hypothetical protein
MRQLFLHTHRAVSQLSNKPNFSPLLYNHIDRSIFSNRKFTRAFTSSQHHSRTPCKLSTPHLNFRPYQSSPSLPIPQSEYRTIYIRSMSSDADYAAFLDKANQDTAPAQQQDLSKKGYGTKSVDTSVPQVLEKVEEYYISDADEPFEPVALKFDGKSITAGMSHSITLR